MKILNLSLDPNALNPQSFVAERSKWYGEVVDSYTMIVPTSDKSVAHLSEKVTVYGSGGKNKPIKLWNIYRLAKNVIREGRCDVISSQDPYYLGLIGYILAKRFHLGLEIQILGIEKFQGIRKIIARYVLQRASSIRVLSARLHERLNNLFVLNKERMIRVPIHVSTKRLSLQPRNAEGSEKMKTEGDLFNKNYGNYVNFLTVSRLTSIKNIALQLKAMKELCATHPNIRLHIVGEGNEESTLKKLSNQYNINDFVLFHGWKDREALGSIYTHSDCFLLTSYYEGWGMVIVEAANASLPIIMTDVGCAGELIIDTISGYIIPSEDLPSLTIAMEKIITNPDQRKKMGAEAKLATERLPSREKVVARYKEAWTYANEHRL